MRKEYLLHIILLLVIFFVVYGLSFSTILNPILRRSYGKDNNIVRSFQVIIVLSVLFFLFLSKKRKLVSSFYGLVSGFLSFLCAYILWFYLLDDSGLSYRIVASILFVASFYIFRWFNWV